METDHLEDLISQVVHIPSKCVQPVIEFPISGSLLVSSPERMKLLSLPPANPEKVSHFRVPALQYPIDLLLHFSRYAPAIPLWVEGGTLRFWQSVVSLAQEMVIRGRYLPAIGTYQNGGICTRWKICPSAYDTQRINLLAKAISPLQLGFQRNLDESAIQVRKNETITTFLESLISRIINLAEQHDLQDPASRYTPIERLKYAQELTALYFLQGYERHLMPLATPQITNGWKNKCILWTDTSAIDIPDDLPWIIVVQISELPDPISPVHKVADTTHEWAISFLIRSADNPDILIPTHEFRQHELPHVALPGDEELQSMLRRTVETLNAILPGLAIEYRSTTDPIIRIPESDLIRFLTHDVRLIEAQGVEFLYPEWWGRPSEPARISLSIQQRQDSGVTSLVGLQTLLHFDYRISIGEDSISSAEFRKLVEQQTSTVRFGKRWVTIDQPLLEQKIKTVEKKYKKHRLSVSDLLRLIARSEDPHEDLTVDPEDAWTADLLTGIKEGWHHRPVEVPESFRGVLRPYQKTGLSFLMACRSLGFGACLADDMGLGKTPQTIAYLLAAKNQGTLKGPSLLICPTSIIGNWERELARFGPDLTCFIHHGPSRLRGESFIQKASESDLIITSYALIPRDLDLLSDLTYAVLILDEVQNIKNSQTKQFRAVRTLSADHRIALTGTPVENHLTELWAIMEVLNPDYLGSLSAFQKIYASPIEKGDAEEKATELRRMIRPFLLRRVKTDTSVISDLPEKMEMQVYCSLTHEQAADYQATVNGLAHDLQQATGIARKGRILSALTRLKQICNFPDTGTEVIDNPERSGKVTRLIEMLEEIRDEGDAAIIFTQYATFAKALARQIHQSLEREVLLLTGSTPRLKREEMINRFARSDGPLFFVISLRAGGTGLNLMRANHVFHIDRWWNPAVEDQATDRTYRIGQTKTVQVHLLITAGTLEEQIHDLISRKRIIADQVISSGEEWLTELPTGELMDVLRLREQVFGDEL
ncbi:MAG: DEAD/DEAH box helicase [Methanospirillum sp.]|uniref:DEAD/DEAH box helicase n=1 Tax=Methanospirillum sp. TaxID=45200 RepID=UPI00236C15B4|nr:DEAD/DEAH box helicase [Methanospirillum sp.]MDD1729757.1 DEAD/DEAH box helicase [Methanospirillum sp.]